ncbi:MAG: hypothetical protein A2Y38_22215 [Spirochaetes bacterium GWB1_59_5]|nr:MAG: hypothetical protein A2Y38_22215 [Spirochaetes bacterium GWB1_59_5]
MKTAGQIETLIQNIGYQFEALLEEQAKAFIQETTTYALKRVKIAPAHLPYVFWVLFEGESHWPELPAVNKQTLGLALRIASDTDNTPRYSAAFQTVPLEVEGQVDQVIEHMGVWSRSSMMVAIIENWLALLRKAAPQVPKITNGEIEAGQAMSWLQLSLRYLLSRFQGWWHYPSLMLHVMAFPYFPQAK